MQFTPSLQRATLVQRYKRFLADVITPDGTELTLHCPNTGAMTGVQRPVIRSGIRRRRIVNANTAHLGINANPDGRVNLCEYVMGLTG